MANRIIDDILPLIGKPSQYLGSEINRVYKDQSDVRLRIALAFPDLYEIGTSHFGLQILYHVLNRETEISAERVFAPEADMEGHLRASRLGLRSLESQTQLGAFDIVGFSLLYELNYTNVLNMLDLADIPFFAAQRDERHPFIIAGGPCTCNPEPVADFFDALLIGDGEEAVLEMSREWLAWHKRPRRCREDLLVAWAQIEGVYVPAFFDAEYDAAGFQRLKARRPAYRSVRRRVVADLDRCPFPHTPIVPYGKPVHDRLRLEVSRGCTRGCRFCQAGMIYRPVRERAPATLLGLTENALQATGYEDLSLLSLSTGDYGCITPLMQQLMDRLEPRHIAVSLPSLRAETLTPELMGLIKRVRKTGFTIAPEAGSQRLRDVINKCLTQKQITDAVQGAFDMGWQVIKLYFMIGLPTETAQDLQALVDLVQTLRQIKGPKGRRGQVNVSVATFIPKAHTPFQWASQISLEESRSRIGWIQEKLRLPGVHFKWQNPEVSQLEGLWARGDRRLSRLLVAAHESGCKFDGWSDKFQYPRWEAALRQTDLNPAFFTARPRDVKEPLAWDHIDAGVNKSFLAQEWQKAQESQATADCRRGVCHECGVCDFKQIKPRVYTPTSVTALSAARNDHAPLVGGYQRWRVEYSKQGTAKFFGHLEMVKVFLRALRRADIPLKHSEGFHPLPKVSFDDPLPLGMESKQEYFYLSTPLGISGERIVRGLKQHLPEGLHAHEAQKAPAKRALPSPAAVTYRVTLAEGGFDSGALARFEQTRECIFTRANRKGKLKKIDLKDIISSLVRKRPDRLEMNLGSSSETTVRPADVLATVFGLSAEQIKRATIVKLCDEKST